MQNKSIGVVVALILVLGVGGLIYYQKNASSPTPTPLPGNPDIGNINPNGAGTSTPATGLTMAQVTQHNSRSSCWAAINGNVYDLTSWIPNHPGGEAAILQLCGTDGSAKFNGQHGSDPRAKSVLAGFKIGTLQ